MEESLIYINLEDMVANFFEVKIEKHLQEYLLIIVSGKIGNSGKASIVYRGEDYALCKNEYYRRINEKKMKGYESKSQVQKKLKAQSLKHKKEFLCDKCGCSISYGMYKKIDKYLRNETDLDTRNDGEMKGKVLCFSCQSEMGIYKGKEKSADK